MPSATSFPADARRSLLLYNLFFPLVFLALLPSFLLRMFRRGGYRNKFGQRLGIFSPAERERLAGREWTWIHSISVGETFVAIKLARKMKELQPDLNVVLSVTTSTGYAQAETAASEWLEVIYNPVDLRSIVARTFKLVRPKRLVFIEAMWPNLLAQARRAGTPVSMVPRLSPRSESRFHRFRAISGPIFRLIDQFCVQEEADIPRWTGLGALPHALTVTGSIKFDTPPAGTARIAEFRALLDRLQVPPDSPILLGGSTFPGEERILGQTLLSLRSRFPDLFLIVVPRHVERSADALSDLESLGLRVARRTQPAETRSDCLLVDTTGELRDWYHLATVVFIGKSLTAIGGQNPVEPVAAGKPVVFGPHMENFRSIVETWLQHQAAVRVPDAAGLERAVADLLTDPARRGELAQRAHAFVEEHAGATERTAREILKI